MIIEIPDKVNKTIERLRAAGYDAYTVGGAVRDAVIGRTAGDWDVTTSALCSEVKAVFDGERIIDTGIKHGTVTLIADGEPIEITTFRIDGEYTDNRHPDSVEFTRNLALDLSRRDFTINALAYNNEDGLVDLFGGVGDVENKIIRCVGEPDKRFNEDGLRIMRALRFSAMLGFTIEDETKQSILRNSHLLSGIAAERITAELSKLIVSSGAGSVLTQYRKVFEELFPCLEGLINETSVSYIENASEDAAHRLSYIILQSETPVDVASEMLKKLKCSKRFSSRVLFLSEYGGKCLGDYDLPQLKLMTGRSSFESMYDLARFQVPVFGARRMQKVLDGLTHIEQANECVDISGLKISGKDILKLGATGEQVGKVLESLLNEVVYGKTDNNRAALMAQAENILGDIL